MAATLETDKKGSERELTSFKDDELGALVKRYREELFTLRNQRVSEKVEDNSRFGKLRRDIARLKSEQARRAAGAAS